MPAGALAPNGSPWTFWYYPSSAPKCAEMLIANADKAWARKLTLFGVPGCKYVGVQDGLPYFEVPGNGVQGLTIEQARLCHIVRMSEAEAGEPGGVSKRNPRT